MKSLEEGNIISFLKENVAPLNDSNFGPGYRSSVHLTDGTLLPCVIFRSSRPVVELAMRRFKQEQSGRSIFAKSAGFGYEEIVKTFVARGNCINGYEIGAVQKSRFAFPFEMLQQIKGETTMGWTAFVARFRDGRCLGFGTRWSNDFFDLPEGYDADQIVEIISNSYLLSTGEIVHHRSLDPNMTIEELGVNREKPFFECYLDGL
ncbi:MAG TPA: hypothetical protein VGM30_19805 [Puia sp.]|jgi:hypothetical protein